MVSPSADLLASPRCRGAITMALLPSLQQVSFIHQTGTLSASAHAALITAATKACEETAAGMAASLKAAVDAERAGRDAAVAVAEHAAAALMAD